ncbi:MRP-L47-domain-containing protein [Coniochaeta ligniaria NRRL 30616]|uniref:Large ribosomal subunit protein uL29m n=1 Tax=Coniochaeta ligniaria NRRL 30616 TaxID=1408157 RepID=A0A1J7JFP3_9PEZI|nr:MRP-L47-domain-containing protein [Coniochaeta ligniaria NRRL 30616]
MATSRALRPSLAAGLLQPCSRLSLPSLSTPLFLQHQQPQQLQRIPSSSPSSSAPFSTSSPVSKRHVYPGARKTRDNNKHRGESSMRRTGPRWRLSVSDEPLPIPVPRAEVPKQETDPDHGLWDFFYDREMVVRTAAETGQHGRAWTAEELRAKSWDDLHSLWWVCCKERNRLATMAWEREKGKYGFGAAEDGARDDEIVKTMKSIRHVLTERYYLWEDALDLAKEDPEINLSGEGQVYTPEEFLVEEDHVEEVSQEEFEKLKAGELPESLEQGEKKTDLAAAVDPSTLPAETPREAPRV